ncbi:unnamed protein product [Notodromas monacha]|uniref:Sorting nexin C-terminal domain-containing protein n=1 Tax=Notodromas monacha TaxID=399045 RepID=A0A7R9GJZ4_9CRUS|nr:unnamed protein product [Notodromas monacha]CAG0924084.1 unnamed protein product [Notodromas monacha]
MLEWSLHSWLTVTFVAILGSLTSAVTLFVVWPIRKPTVERKICSKYAKDAAIIQAKVANAQEEEDDVQDVSVPIINPRVDPSLHALIDLFVRDFFTSWFSKLADDPKRVEKLLRMKVSVQIREAIYKAFLDKDRCAVPISERLRIKLEAYLSGIDETGEGFYDLKVNTENLLCASVFRDFLGSSEGINAMSILSESQQSGDDLDDLSVGETFGLGSGKVRGSKASLVESEKNYAQSQLNLLEEKLSKKVKELEAAKAGGNGSKTAVGLEKDVKCLTDDVQQLSCFAARSALWSEHLGQWRACIQSVEATEDGLMFLLVVQKEEAMLSPVEAPNGPPISSSTPETTDGGLDGWIVSRKLAEFHELRHRVGLIAGDSLKSKDLPALGSGKSFFGRGWDRAELDKARAQVQTFLNAVLRNERLSHSEDVFTFLCPVPEHLLRPGGSCGSSSAMLSPAEPGKPGKARFSLSTLFQRDKMDDLTGKSDEDVNNGSSSTEQQVGLMEGSGGGSRDSIAEPLYGLVQEVFEVQGIFRWLRKTLITFVQITYGRTINRQIRETVSWLVSDAMVITYCGLVKEAYWPKGKLAPAAQPRSDEQKLRTRYEAKEKFLVSVPAVVSNLVGQQNGKRGAVRIFETIQDHRLNKQLVYGAGNGRFSGFKCVSFLLSCFPSDLELVGAVRAKWRSTHGSRVRGVLWTIAAVPSPWGLLAEVFSKSSVDSGTPPVA